MRKNSLASVLVPVLGIALILNACSKKPESPLILSEDPEVIEEIKVSEKNHVWYYFGENTIEQIDLPQNSPLVREKPWTEAIRIACAASVPVKTAAGSFDAYALVNRTGVLAFCNGKPSLYADASIFSTETVDSLVFSGSSPVFFLYRSTFFNEKPLDETGTLLSSRPFLVEFNPGSRVTYPLVSYANLNLEETDQISGFFWDGTKWACSVKTPLENGVSFSYFAWEPVIELTDLSPALNRDALVFYSSSEAEYRGLNTPRLYSDAPARLKELLASLPSEFPFYVTWRDESGTSPVSYFNEGSGASPLNAKAAIAPASGYMAAIFEDGTTYIRTTDGEKNMAFRLPRLPASFKYGDFAISGDYLIVAWEETNFYKTSRTGFISVDLSLILN